MTAPLLRSNVVHLVLGLALFACGPEKVNTAPTRTRTFASARVLNLVSDVASADTILAVKDDLPGGFAAVPSPGLSRYQSVATGPWTAHLTQAGTTLASSLEIEVTEGQRWTIIESGPTSAATVTPKKEEPPTLTATQSATRIVVGAATLSDAAITLDGAAALPSAQVGSPSDWSTADASMVRIVVVSLPGQTIRFDVPATAAGLLHTYALVSASTTDTALRLIDFSEPTGGDATAATPLEPTP